MGADQPQGFHFSREAQFKQDKNPTMYLIEHCLVTRFKKVKRDKRKSFKTLMLTQ
jgi:hypothetical protein